MEITKEDFERLRQLEESLWRAEYRFDRAYMERTLAPDFLEFGRWPSIQTRGHPQHRKWCNTRYAAAVTVCGAANRWGRCVGHVHERNHIREPLERANRSSLWSRYPIGWRLRFHQGTPA